MKMKLHICFTAIIICAAVPTLVVAQEQPKNSFPFYVRLTQQYQYPGTELVSAAGMIEQVVNEDPENYVLSTPGGTTVKVPKSLVLRVTEREAASGLIAERATYASEMEKAAMTMKQMAGTVEQLQAERQQIMQTIQLALAVRQQQSNSGSSAQQVRDELKAIRDIQELMKGPRK